jgi:hypothetical protein
MSDTLRDLLSNGFMIYPSKGMFVLKKEPVPETPYRIEERQFPTYAAAVEEAENILKSPKLNEWTVLVRYNRGLGIEYKHLSTVFACKKEEAEALATLVVEKFAEEHRAMVAETRVRPKI